MRALHRSLPTLTLALCAAIAAPASQAQVMPLPPALDVLTCNPLRDLYDNASSNFVNFTMTTVRRDDRFASYVEGSLDFDGFWLFDADSAQSFSDRTTEICGDAASFFRQPFSEGAKDSLRLYVGREGEMWIYNNTWGGEWLHLQGECRTGLLYAFDGAGTIFTLSFSQGPSKQIPR